MDQVKIGRYIAECRKAKGMTQAQLAEKLHITDRAVSRWETGKGMPDTSLMPDLCQELGITVGELLNGESVPEEEYKDTAEQLLVELQRGKEESDRLLLKIEWVLSGIITVMFLGVTLLAIYAEMPMWLRILTFVLGFILFIIGVGYAVQIEQRAGYYECRECHYKYVPSYRSVLFAAHSGRTRYMKCPECGKRSWQKKVISRE